MRYLLALFCTVACAAVTVTPDSQVTLYQSAGGFATEAECAAEAARLANASTSTSGSVRYLCQRGTLATYSTAPPPACGPAPPVEMQTVQCPAGSTGSWTQTRSAVSAPAPQCWTPGPWAPSTAPAGSCTTPPPTTVVDGGTFTITGSGFGTNTATVTSLKNTIEATTVGTAITAIPALQSHWINADGVEGGTHVSRVGSTRVFYGTKSISCEPASPGTDGRFGIALDTGGPITDVFIRDYFRLDTLGSTSGQHKWYRFNSDGGVTDSAPANFYIADWYPGGNDFAESTATGWQSGLTPPRQPPDPNWGTSSSTFGMWFEREIRFVPSTSTGATNGRLEVRIRRTTDGVEVSNNVWTTVNTYKDANRIRYVVLHNYLGNGLASLSAGTNHASVYIDGLYISNGSQARVYLCNAATWAACTRREIQDWTAWSNTSITFTIRKGWLSTLTGAYAYVINNSGAVVNSSGIALGGTP